MNVAGTEEATLYQFLITKNSYHFDGVSASSAVN